MHLCTRQYFLKIEARRFNFKSIKSIVIIITVNMRRDDATCFDTNLYDDDESALLEEEGGGGIIHELRTYLTLADFFRTSQIFPDEAH